MDWTYRTIKVKVPNIPDDRYTRDLLQSCGPVSNFLVDDTGVGLIAGYFIEYANKDSVSLACALQRDRDTSISLLCTNPALCQEYQTAISLASRASPSTPASLHYTEPPSATVSVSTSRLPPSPTYSHFDSIPPVSYKERSSSSMSDIKSKDDLAPEKIVSDPILVLPPSPISILSSDSSLSYTVPLPVSFTPPASSSSPLTPDYHPATLNSHLTMSLHEELISFDLNSLEKDPTAIIALLKVTSSERDKWMVVAGHYRRLQNIPAAVNVVTTMIEVMREHQIPDRDLKPAFLMLSSCELELAKHARASGDRIGLINQHSAKAEHWLQKVYGQATPSSRQNDGNNTLCLQIGPNTSLASQTTISDSSHQPTPNISAAPEATSPSTTFCSNSSSAPSRSNFSRISILEREVQSLRDRQANFASTLATARAAKRRIEDDCVAEREQRRRLERRLAEKEKEYQVARSMEDFALGQARKEVEGRRDAEIRVAEEVERRKAAEAKLAEKERKTGEAEVVPLFEGLADMFKRAAKGEGIVLPPLGVIATVSNRSSGSGMAVDE